MADYYVYILTNRTRRLYVGVTSDLLRRVYEHKHKVLEGFTSKYNIGWLVYYEWSPDVRAAIEREKQIKKWRREKKLKLVATMNPEWKDLSADWFVDG